MEQLLKLAKALQNVSTSSEFYFDFDRSGALERQIAQAKIDNLKTKTK